MSSKSNKSDSEVLRKSIIHEEAYISFLKKKLNSLHFKEVASEEEFKREKLKYDKAKLKLTFLKNQLK